MPEPSKTAPEDLKKENKALKEELSYYRRAVGNWMLVAGAVRAVQVSQVHGALRRRATVLTAKLFHLDPLDNSPSLTRAKDMDARDKSAAVVNLKVPDLFPKPFILGIRHNHYSR